MPVQLSGKNPICASDNEQRSVHEPQEEFLTREGSRERTPMQHAATKPHLEALEARLLLNGSPLWMESVVCGDSGVGPPEVVVGLGSPGSEADTIWTGLATDDYTDEYSSGSPVGLGGVDATVIEGKIDYRGDVDILELAPPDEVGVPLDELAAGPEHTRRHEVQICACHVPGNDAARTRFRYRVWIDQYKCEFACHRIPLSLPVRGAWPPHSIP